MQYIPGTYAGNALEQYVQQEFARISEVIQNISDGAMDIRDVVPDRPRNGLFYADGTNWDPGSGKGIYRYDEDTDTFVFLGGGGGAVSSVFTRTGAVVAVVGDYASFYSPLHTTNVQNGSYTIVLADAWKTISKESGGAGETYTFPANSSVAFPVGTIIGVNNDGGGVLTVALTTDTLTGTDGATGSRSLGDSHVAILEKTKTTEWKYMASDL